MKSDLQAVADTLLAHERILIAGHVNPDGDALGSTLALAIGLRGLGKNVRVLFHDPVPAIYKWLPFSNEIRRAEPGENADVAVICDVASAERTGSVAEAIKSSNVTVVIDHHVPDVIFGDVRMVDTTRSATGEIIFDLLALLGEPLSKDLADCLMCAIITDTGSFRFSNTKPRTFRIAAELQEAGARPSEINEQVFEQRSFASQKLLGCALQSLTMLCGDTIAWGRVTAADFARFNASDEETEGIVNQLRAVSSARVGVLFREVPGKRVRISIRSREGFDVAAIAHQFGGGGHRLAAGCSHDGPLEVAENEVIAALKLAVSRE